jgi:hypothetical protein
MRDGTVLRANVYTPDQPGPHPIVLIRTPYNKDRPFNGAYGGPDVWAGRCYIAVAQDVRGQYKSDGVWYPFRSEATDGYDTIEWAAALPKSNGKVGMYGFSYPGTTQWLPATLRPPHLTAILPAMTSSDYRDGWTYEGGALYQAFAQYWPMNSIANSAVRHLPEGAALDAEFGTAQREYVDKWRWFLPLKDYPPLHPKDQRVAAYHFDWLRHPGDRSAHLQHLRSRAVPAALRHWSRLSRRNYRSRLVRLHPRPRGPRPSKRVTLSAARGGSEGYFGPTKARGARARVDACLDRSDGTG